MKPGGQSYVAHLYPLSSPGFLINPGPYWSTQLRDEVVPSKLSLHTLFVLLCWLSNSSLYVLRSSYVWLLLDTLYEVLSPLYIPSCLARAIVQISVGFWALLP